MSIDPVPDPLDPATDPPATPATAADAAPTAADAAPAPRPGLPARTTPPPAGDRAPLDLARRIVELAEDKKAADIVLLEIAAAHDRRRLPRHLLGRLGAPARRDRRRHRRRAQGGGDPPPRPRGRGDLPLGPARRGRRDRARLRAAGARVLRPGAALVRGEDGPPRPVVRSADRAGDDRRAATVPATHRPRAPSAPTIPGRWPSGSAPVPEVVVPDGEPPRSMPRVQPPSRRLALRRDLPRAGPQRTALLRDPGRSLRGLPPALHRPGADRGPPPGTGPLRLRDRVGSRPPGAGLVQRRLRSIAASRGWAPDPGRRPSSGAARAAGQARATHSASHSEKARRRRRASVARSPFSTVSSSRSPSSAPTSSSSRQA